MVQKITILGRKKRRKKIHGVTKNYHFGKKKIPGLEGTKNNHFGKKTKPKNIPFWREIK